VTAQRFEGSVPLEHRGAAALLVIQKCPTVTMRDVVVNRGSLAGAATPWRHANICSNIQNNLNIE
jgi:hypothetical protein